VLLRLRRQTCRTAPTHSNFFLFFRWTDSLVPFHDMLLDYQATATFRLTYVVQTRLITAMQGIYFVRFIGFGLLPHSESAKKRAVPWRSGPHALSAQITFSPFFCIYSVGSNQWNGKFCFHFFGNPGKGCPCTDVAWWGNTSFVPTNACNLINSGPAFFNFFAQG